MLKHISNGGNANQGSRPDSSIIMEPRDPQPHRFRSPNSSRISTQQSYPLNVSQFSQIHSYTPNLDNSKHSIYSNAAVLSPPGNKVFNGGLNISRIRNQSSFNKFVTKSKEVGVKETLVSLGLLCLVSLLLALLSLIFLLKVSPVTINDIRELLRAEQLTVITAEEYLIVYEVTLALCALTLSLNLCCLLVCAIQFLFAVKLVQNSHGGSNRTSKYLQKSSVSRVCAMGGLFISIPVFLTGIILYTFIQFHSTPAIVTSVFIGLGIIFCGCAMVHNVFIWQREKTNAVKELAQQQELTQQHHNSYHSIASPPLPLNQSHVSAFNHSIGHPLASVHGNGPYIIRPSTTTPPAGESLNISKHPREASGSVSPLMPPNNIDISSVTTTNSPHELSTLV
ncbi:uncharacterized protein [Euwallacea similis]|uniref:uncharacterized protein n=1 Tax=Euwallacea similis TaxID=1736056 RepID=UPI00344C0E1D